MTIAIGDLLPDAEFLTMTPDGQKRLSTAEIFEGRRIVLFAVPGAFTPTCTMNHLPGFARHAEEILASGIDAIACTAVNDVHVMKAWSASADTDGRIMMLADGNGAFARALGLSIDLSASGMGERSRRYSMIVADRRVRTLNIEEKPGVNVSGAETILAQL